MTRAAPSTVPDGLADQAELATLAGRLAYPLPIYMGRDTTVAASPAEVGALLRSLRALVRVRGYRRLVPCLAATELPRRGRFRVWVDWIGEGAAGRRRLFRTVCYSRGTAEANVIQMIQIESLDRPRREARGKAA